MEDRLQSEHQRSSHYFRNTEDAIIKILKSFLLTPHLNAILSMSGSGLDNMIDLKQQDDLARLYTLFMLVPEGLPVLKRALKDSIAERGKLVNEAEGSVAAGDLGGSGSVVAPAPGRERQKPGDQDADVDIEGPGDDSSAQQRVKRTAANGKAFGSHAASPTGKKTLDAALKWVQDVLDLKDVFDRLLKFCFKDDKGIQTAMNEVR